MSSDGAQGPAGDIVRDAPAGVRALGALGAADVAALGEEVYDLAMLLDAGVPLAPSWVISFDADPLAISEFLAERLKSPPPSPKPLGSVPPPPPNAPCLKLRPWFRTMALGQRAEERWPALADVLDPEDVAERVQAAFAGIRAPRMSAALAHAPGGLSLRSVLCDEGPAGYACSVDPDDGDPASIAVWLPERRPWRIDRKTMRVLEEGHGALSRSVLERAADLADRAQLALGRPVEIN